VVFIYNKRLIPAGDVPDSHAALAKLIASQTDKFKNKVTTYDIEKSGLGFMLSCRITTPIRTTLRPWPTSPKGACRCSRLPAP
jgi:hypothetical protein